MLRGYLVYILMLLASAAGLWAVIQFGQSLQAPAEIAGAWEVRWETASPTGGGHHGTLLIDQSGRYCTFHFDDARTMGLKMTSGTALGRGDPRMPLARLAGEGYHAVLYPTAVRGVVKLELSGRGQHRGVAERIGTPLQGAAAPSDQPPTLVPVVDARR